MRQAAEVAVTLAHDEAPSEQDKKREAKSITNGVAKAASEYKQTYIEELNVDGQTVYVTNLQLLLQRYCQQSREFAKAVREALSCVSEPLSMVAYVDETVSGNPLKPLQPKEEPPHLPYFLGNGAQDRASRVLVGGRSHHQWQGCLCVWWPERSVSKTSCCIGIIRITASYTEAALVWSWKVNTGCFVASFMRSSQMRLLCGVFWAAKALQG